MATAATRPPRSQAAGGGGSSEFEVAEGAQPSGTDGGGLAPTPTLVRELEATPACTLTPLAFFVSWQGVLTVAYT